VINTNLRMLATIILTIAGVAIAGLFTGILMGASPARAGTPAAMTAPATARFGPTVISGLAHNNALYGVSCTRWTQCLAVGSQAAGTATNFHPLAEQWNGHHWKVTPMPGPTTLPQALALAVSCHSARNCVAVGYNYSYSGNQYAPLAELWNGGSWHIIQDLNPATISSVALYDVSCRAFAGCLAVGASGVSTSRSKAFAERRTDGRWHLLRVPQPSGATATALLDISCTGEDCLAVGYYTVAGGRTLALAERWNGSSWHLLPAASGAGSLTELYGVSCNSATLCMAVGENKGTQLRPLTELWEQGRWRLVRGGQVAGGVLSDISCPARRWCSAVGLAGRRPLTEVWSGKRWQVVPAPPAPGHRASALWQISCRTMSARCITVGYQYTPGKSVGKATLAEWWNGRSWRSMTTPNP
jgi:hypothetical protein